MNKNDNDQQCQMSGHNMHKWMMIVCALIIVGSSLYYLLNDQNQFNGAWLGGILLPLILCLVMHGLMMKFMMKGARGKKKEGEDKSKDNVAIEHKIDA